MVAPIENPPRSAAPSSSVEDYVKVIYAFTEWQPQSITSSQLAARLGVANSSVSEMVRKLKELGLVDHQPYSAIRLTEPGRQLALAMVRRHRLLETYLVRELNYSWDEVHNEAELLEHTVSDKLIDRIAEKLDHPGRDPHGDPIPTAAGSVVVPHAHLLKDLDDGHSGRITRISDANPDLLRYLSAEHIDLDTPLTFIGHRPFGGPAVVRLGLGPQARQLDLGAEVGSSLWISGGDRHPGCTLET